jgi:hypothetical protein
MPFSRTISRGLVDRQGIEVSSRGFDNLVVSEGAERGERGRTFADKMMDVMSRVSSNILRSKSYGPTVCQIPIRFPELTGWSKRSWWFG